MAFNIFIKWSILYFYFSTKHWNPSTHSLWGCLQAMGGICYTQTSTQTPLRGISVVYCCKCFSDTGCNDANITLIPESLQHQELKVEEKQETDNWYFGEMPGQDLYIAFTPFEINAFTSSTFWNSALPWQLYLHVPQSFFTKNTTTGSNGAGARMVLFGDAGHTDIKAMPECPLCMVAASQCPLTPSFPGPCPTTTMRRTSPDPAPENYLLVLILPQPNRTFFKTPCMDGLWRQLQTSAGLNLNPTALYTLPKEYSSWARDTAQRHKRLSSRHKVLSSISGFKKKKTLFSVIQGCGTQ